MMRKGFAMLLGLGLVAATALADDPHNLGGLNWVSHIAAQTPYVSWPVDFWVCSIQATMVNQTGYQEGDAHWTASNLPDNLPQIMDGGRTACPQWDIPFAVMDGGNGYPTVGSAQCTWPEIGTISVTGKRDWLTEAGAYVLSEGGTKTFAVSPPTALNWHTDSGQSTSRPSGASTQYLGLYFDAELGPQPQGGHRWYSSTSPNATLVADGRAMGSWDGTGFEVGLSYDNNFLQVKGPGAVLDTYPFVFTLKIWDHDANTWWTSTYTVTITTFVTQDGTQFQIGW